MPIDIFFETEQIGVAQPWQSFEHVRSLGIFEQLQYKRKCDLRPYSIAADNGDIQWVEIEKTLAARDILLRFTPNPRILS